MCGRYTLRTPGPDLQNEFQLESAPELKARYNIAPTQPVAAVLASPEHKRRLELLRWGLIPHWAKDARIGSRLINARADTAQEKPAFRHPLRSQRCLVLADGFYEWQDTGSGKQPIHFRRQDGKPFALAGLWDEWRAPSGERIRSCTLLTTTPNALLSRYHNRMPVILSRAEQARWLSAGPLSADELAKLWARGDDDALAAFPVSKLVNSVKVDSPDCLLTEGELVAARGGDLFGPPPR